MKSDTQKIRTILALCARDSAHRVMQRRLNGALANFSDWENLIREAELHGMAPLLYKHLTAVETAIPSQQKSILQGLYLRHRRANSLRNAALKEMLAAFERALIDVLLIKGSCLSNLVYSDVGLRPMRDIDILVRPSDAPAARAVLMEENYQPAPHSHVPEGHYHLDPLLKQVGGMEINIEIHHNLLPFLPGYSSPSFDHLYAGAIVFEIDGVKASSLGCEDMLWYVYQHGFAMPLTYGPFRFIHAADVISLVEKMHAQIDWQKMRGNHPKIYNILAALHHLSPWSEQLVNSLGLRIGRRPKGVGQPFAGWPCRRLRDFQGRAHLSLLRETLLPPPWWLHIYYGSTAGLSQLRTLIVEHPRNCLWWFRFFLPSFCRNRWGLTAK